MTAPLAALVGLLLGLGLLLGQAAFRPAPPPRPARRRPGPVSRVIGYYSGTGLVAWRRRAFAFAAIAGGLLAWLVTGWLIGVLVIPAVAAIFPYLLRGSGEKRRIARLAAMEEWVRSLSGLLEVGSGLEQALTTSARSAPPLLAAEVERLAARLNSGVRTADALRAFGRDLDDATGDYIVAALLLASKRRGSGLVDVLEGIAASVSDQVRNRREIESEMARPQSSIRLITIIAAGSLTLLVFLGDHMAAYGTPVGQAILGALLTAYFACLVWMRKTVATPPLPRLLDETATHGVSG